MEALKDKRIKIIHLDAQGVASVVPLKEKKRGPAFLTTFFTSSDSSRNSAKPLPSLREAISLDKIPSKNSPARLFTTRARTFPRISASQVPAQRAPVPQKEGRQEVLSHTRVEIPKEKSGTLFLLRAQIFAGQIAALAKKSGRDLRTAFSRPQSSIKRVKPLPAPRQEPVLKKNRPKITSQKAEEIYQWVALEEKIIHDYTQQELASPEAPVESNSWVALEEKIVHFYAEEKAGIADEPILLPSSPEKQSLPAFETFSTQTTAFPASKVSIRKEPFRGPKINFMTLGIIAVVALGLVVGALVFQGVSSQQEFSWQLEKLQGEKKQVERAYGETQQALESQLAEEAWLNSRILAMNDELKVAQGQRDAHKANLVRITNYYESQINSLREDIRNKESVIVALKAQVQVLGEVFNQASGVSVPSAISPGNGRVSEIEVQKGFFVVDKGSSQGVKYGDSVIVSRAGVGLTVGRIDRVYSTMSSVIVPDRNVLRNVREGDSVFFV